MIGLIVAAWIGLIASRIKAVSLRHGLRGHWARRLIVLTWIGLIEPQCIEALTLLHGSRGRWSGLIAPVDQGIGAWD